MKKCAVCKEEFEPFNSMIRHCSPACGFKLHKKNEQKKTKAVHKQWNKEKAEYRKANKPMSKLKSEAQASINLNVRLRDYFEPCISCNKSRQEIEAEQGWKTGGAWDAGHFKSRGAYPQLRFNLKNIHKQCKTCNGGKTKFSAKQTTVLEGYKVNIINKIGVDAVEALECYQEITTYDREYLERIKTLFNKKARMRKKRLGI